MYQDDTAEWFRNANAVDMKFLIVLRQKNMNDIQIHDFLSVCFAFLKLGEYIGTSYIQYAYIEKTLYLSPKRGKAYNPDFPKSVTEWLDEIILKVLLELSRKQWVSVKISWW